MDGRFDLSAPAGTCYLASDPAAAVRERLGPTLAGTGITYDSDVDSVRISALRAPSGPPVADTIAAGAASFGGHPRNQYHHRLWTHSSVSGRSSPRPVRRHPLPTAPVPIRVLVCVLRYCEHLDVSVRPGSVRHTKGVTRLMALEGRVRILAVASLFTYDDIPADSPAGTRCLHRELRLPMAAQLRPDRALFQARCFRRRGSPAKAERG